MHTSIYIYKHVFSLMNSSVYTILYGKFFFYTALFDIKRGSDCG